MSANAIEMLRNTIAFRETTPQEIADALAAVEALLEAAANMFGDRGSLERTAELAVNEPTFLSDPFYALAAAVRRMETGQ